MSKELAQITANKSAIRKALAKCKSTIRRRRKWWWTVRKAKRYGTKKLTS